MLDKLLSTGNTPLIEPNLDKTWASAAPFLSKEISNGTWKGHNLLGILLVEVRVEFKQRQNIQANDSESDKVKSNDIDEEAEGDVEGA